MVYTVTFNPAIDYVIRMGEVKLGATNRSEREEIYFGGKGIFLVEINYDAEGKEKKHHTCMIEEWYE